MGFLFKVASKILAKAVTQKFLLEIFKEAGDHITKKTSGKLDDKIWAKVREKL